ncbi:dual specificity protein phosphatase 14-like [Uranotaenia lowii]|uniref:dual specificity protein phosphatase 14-like n=1 Tax=Uranotaenia lowii TaxID=190385 RepID=UPI00247A5F31|nr:dual specificity protein phosphatase 14-like [Uranotaenia lowii]
MKVVNINRVNHQQMDGLQMALAEDPLTPKASTDVMEGGASGEVTACRDTGGGGGGYCSGIVLPSSSFASVSLPLHSQTTNASPLPATSSACSVPSSSSSLPSVSSMPSSSLEEKSNQIQTLLERHENPRTAIAQVTSSTSISTSFITSVSKLLKNLHLCGGSAATVPMMQQLGVTLVINATTETELPNTPLPCDDTSYLRIPVKDNREADLNQYFHQVADRIEQESQNNGIILVHCVAGVSRSASLCLAYLMKYHRMSLKDAYNHVKARRPQIRPNVGFVKQLMEFEHELTGSRSVSMVYCHALDQELPDIYEPEYRSMELLYQKFRRNIAKR